MAKLPTRGSTLLQIGVVLCLLLLVAFRLWLVPASTALSSGFTHDSGYISIVARNLAEGKGLVNDASWLVFLHPKSLPMPFHNANPLYPVAIAVIARTTGLEIVRAGYLVSALGQILLALATFALVQFFLRNWKVSLCIALSVGVFPPLWEDSLRLLPDALCAGLLMASLAFVVRARSFLSAALGGVFLGLAWLTRSTALLVLPAIFFYIFAQWRLRKGLVRSAVIISTALAVASPWLIHTARVWGNPVRSDNTFSLLQDYCARSYDGSLQKFWHSTTTPPSPIEVARRDGARLLGQTLLGIPRVAGRLLFRGWAQGSYAAALAFVILCGALYFACRPLAVSRLLFTTTLLYGVTQVAIFAVRGKTAEVRYLAPFTALAVIWMSVGAWRCWCLAKTGNRRLLASFSLGVAALVAISLIPVRTVHLFQELTTPNPTLTKQRLVALAIHKEITGQAPVVLIDPYFYSFDTRSQAISLPAAEDEYLLAYMDRYKARYILLTADELAVWRPQWANASARPQGLRLLLHRDGAYLFERSGVSGSVALGSSH